MGSRYMKSDVQLIVSHFKNMFLQGTLCDFISGTSSKEALLQSAAHSRPEYLFVALLKAVPNGFSLHPTA